MAVKRKYLYVFILFLIYIENELTYRKFHIIHIYLCTSYFKGPCISVVSIISLPPSLRGAPKPVRFLLYVNENEVLYLIKRTLFACGTKNLFTWSFNSVPSCSCRHMYLYFHISSFWMCNYLLCPYVSCSHSALYQWTTFSCFLFRFQGCKPNMVRNQAEIKLNIKRRFHPDFRLKG
jgi:hypothetical protein